MSDRGGPRERLAEARTRYRRRTTELRSIERRRRIRSRLLVGLLIVTALVVPAGLVARDVLIVRDALVAAQRELDSVRRAVEARDITRAADRATLASERLAVAEERLAAPALRTVAGLPRIGAPVALVDTIVRASRAGLDVADVLLAPEVVAGVDVRVADGRIDLAPVLTLSAALDDAPIELLALRLAALERADLTLAPAEVRAARTQLLGLAQPLVPTLTTARDVARGLPVMLGAQGPRRHLVAVQTSAELRGTGGLIGVLAVLEADGGELRLGEPRAFDAIEAERAAQTGTAAGGADGADGAGPADPVLLTLPSGAGVRLDPAFAARYGFTGPTRGLSNVNVDPDVPTTGEVLLDLYEARTGQRLDGVVLLDPVALQALMVALDATLRLPEELVAGTAAPSAIPPDRLARFVLVDLYEHFGDGRATERNAVAVSLSTQALEALFGRSWDSTRVAGALADAAAGRHVQVHARDAVVADAFARLPVSGRLADALTDPLRDTFAVTVNNAVGGKQDVHVTHATRVRVTLGVPEPSGSPERVVAPDGTVRLVRSVPRSVTVRQTVVNPLAAGAFDLYVTGNCLTGPGQGCFAGLEGDHRAWLTFWLRGGDRVAAVRDAEGFPPVRSGTFHGAGVIDAVLEVPSRSEASIELEAEGSVRVEVLGDGSVVYRLAWWRQAKAVPDLIDVEVVAPDGWRVVSVTTHGGETRVPLFGPSGETPLTVGRRPGAAVVSGSVGSGVEVEVVLRRD